METGEREQKLGELCCLLVERWRVEQVHERAQWRVSYYRKLRTKVFSAESQEKLERARLEALKTQEQVIENRNSSAPQIILLVKELEGVFTYKRNSQINGLNFPRAGKSLDADKIRTMADEYEANKALTKALEDNEES